MTGVSGTGDDEYAWVTWREINRINGGPFRNLCEASGECWVILGDGKVLDSEQVLAVQRVSIVPIVDPTAFSRCPWRSEQSGFRCHT